MNDFNSEFEKSMGKGKRITILFSSLSIFAMALSTTGCSILAQKVADSVTQKAIGGIAGVIMDFSLLLSKVESNGGTPHRIVIAFNADRYDPWACAWTSSYRESSELPFKRAYHIKLRLNSIHGQIVTVANQIDLPAETKSSRIPVEVISFSDPDQQLPLARVDEIFTSGNQPHTTQYGFEYSAGDWRPVTKK